MAQLEEIKLLAAGLGVGESISGLCPYCGGGRTREKSFSVTNKGGNLVWICFRASCGQAGGEEGVTSTKPLKDLKPKLVPNLYQGSIAHIPEVYVEYYLSKYPCFSEREFRTSCGWSPEYKRTIWAVRSPAGIVRGYELRSHNRYDRPKTLHFRHLADQPWCGHTIAAACGPVVLVEDLVSAQAARVVGYQAVSLMGTGLNIDKIIEITKFYPGQRLLLCLDRDATNKALVYSDRFALLADLRVCPLNQDLKYLAKEELGALLRSFDNNNDSRSTSSTG